MTGQWWVATGLIQTSASVNLILLRRGISLKHDWQSKLDMIICELIHNKYFCMNIESVLFPQAV